MTEDELAVVDQLGHAWDGFLRLPALHSSDRMDFMKAIHDAQRIIMARPAMRDLARRDLPSE
ncbi:hypothetical protein [Sphingobium yanoikuyae]|uniref:hypothetical protein n=1 Tax=Sphingobium yanoikuyae TaxID=13690 RepID=UPI0011131E9D|nr:hypothetical protein [Sphingobium yanoikuyae]